MPKRERKFADDGWAVWVDGDDTSTVYINDWLNPKGTSYVDIAVRIRGASRSKKLYVYVPFPISANEIDDVSLLFQDVRILQTLFSAACIIDYKKNAHTSEVAYNGKTVDIVHISTAEYTVQPLAGGTLISVGIDELRPFLDNDEVYFIWRMPHKSFNEVFKPRVNVHGLLGRLRELITSPVLSQKYGYSVRINESRLLPEEITRISAFHRQKLKKAVIVISIDESYEINDSGCYRINRLEESSYRAFLPANYACEDVITYQWQQDREYNFHGQFNFYYTVLRNSVSRVSMFMYVVMIMAMGVIGNLIASVIYELLTSL